MWIFAPDSTLQDSVFVRKGLLQWNLRIVHRDALGAGHRSIETQSLADDAFEVREGVDLFHGWRIGRAGAQLDTELGLDCGVTGECK